MTVIFLGSLWGFLEATLGGLLHAIHFPLTGSIMGPIGFAILFIAVKRGLKPASLMAIASVAASFKFFDIFLFNLSPFKMEIINPAQAIIIQGLAFTIFAKLFVREDLKMKILASTGVVLIATTLFNAVSFFAVSGKAPALANLSTTLGISLPISIVATFLLISSISKVEIAKIEAATLYRTPILLQGTASAVLIAASLMAQKWLG